MVSKLNYQEISSYSRKFAATVCDAFFRSHPAISGKQIVELCENKQINFFVVKTIFIKWQEESTKIKSPFFNYADPEVVKAMTVLMNTLSRNISVERPTFEPILADAVADTLILTLSPSAYYSRLLQGFDQDVNVASQLKAIAKYIKIHKSVFDRLFYLIEQEPGPVIPLARSLELLDKVVEEQLPLDEPEKIFQLFDSVLPVRPKDFIVQEEDPLAFGENLPLEPLKEEATQPLFALDLDEQTPATTERFVWESTSEQPQSEQPAENPVLEQTQESPVYERAAEPQVYEQPVYQQPVYERPVEVEQPVYERPAEQPVYERTAEQPVYEPVKAEEAEEPQKEVSLNERFAQESMTLNEKLASQNRPASIYEVHRNAKIQSLKSYIPLNKKFSFINELFGGDSKEFEDAINMIDQCTDYHKAIMLIKEKYFRRFSWDMEKEEVKEFYEMVSRKF